MEELLTSSWFFAAAWVIILIIFGLRKRKTMGDWIFGSIGIVVLSVVAIFHYNVRGGHDYLTLPTFSLGLYTVFFNAIAYFIGSFICNGGLFNFVMRQAASSRKKKTWALMIEVGKEFGMRFRKPDPSRELDFGAVIGKIKGYNINFGLRRSGDVGRSSIIFYWYIIDVKFPHPLNGFLIHTKNENWHIPERAKRFKTDKKEFDRIFTGCYATREVRDRFMKATENRDFILNFYKKWIGSEDMLIREDYISINASKMPFIAHIPGENKYLFDDEKISGALREFVNDLVELAERTCAAAGNPRYYGGAKPDREKRFMLDKKLMAIAGGEEGEASDIKTLVQKGADPNAADESRVTVLMMACEAGSEEAVKILLMNGVRVDAQDELMRTPFLHAAEGGSIEILDLLVREGADPLTVDSEDNTALHIAAAGMRELEPDEEKAFFMKLLSFKIDGGALNSEGKSALSIAEYNELTGAMEVLKNS